MELPNYLVGLSLSSAPDDYTWDNDVFDRLLGVTDEDNPGLIGALLAISVRASFSLGIACCEWVVARVQGYVDTNDALARIEAAWASTLDPRYAKLPGPADQTSAPEQFANPLYLAMLLLADSHGRLLNDASQIRSNTQALAMEVDHIAGRHPAYEPWLSESLGRAREHFPAADKTVGEESLVPKNFFEPGFVWREGAARETLEAFVSGLDPAGNPYLCSPEEMRAAGFTGAPYGR